MSKPGVLLLSLTVFVSLGGSASAQIVLPGLPEVQAVNASAQLGTIWPTRSPSVPSTNVADFDLWGWGVETEFHLPFQDGSKWEASLAVGYNQLSLSADLKGRHLRGTLRDLPALSLYFGRAKRCSLEFRDRFDPSAAVGDQLVKTCSQGGWYWGLTIAESELINGRLIRTPDPGTVDPGPIKISAGSFSAGVAVGYENGPVFIELGYVGRYFPALAYDGIPAATGFPADLDQRMYAGGFVLRVGATLDLQKPAVPKVAISCAGASTEIKVGSEMDLKHECDGDQLNVHVRKKPAATPPHL
ncbi:MAG TPA: hypothetical protein VF516_05955 [Kofleriaceae bacterium]